MIATPRRTALLAATAMLCGAGLVSAASVSPGQSFATYLRHNPTVAKTCGQPLTHATWTDKRHLHQRFAHCTLRGSFRVLTATPLPKPTVTPQPTPRPSPTTIPTVAPFPTARPTAIPLATPVPSTDPIQRLLGEINAERASHGYAPLILDDAMSDGSVACIGAVGHAQSMASQGTIGHWDFPGDVCGYPGLYFTAGENVGVSSGSENQAIDAIQAGMLSEPWSPGCSGSHHCNEDSPSFTHIGLGIIPGVYYGQSAWFVSEDFAG